MRRLLWSAGHLPQPAVGALVVGKVGTDLTIEEGAVAAKYVALNILATIKCALHSCIRGRRLPCLLLLLTTADRERLLRLFLWCCCWLRRLAGCGGEAPAIDLLQWSLAGDTQPMVPRYLSRLYYGRRHVTFSLVFCLPAFFAVIAAAQPRSATWTRSSASSS